MVEVLTSAPQKHSQGAKAGECVKGHIPTGATPHAAASCKLCITHNLDVLVVLEGLVADLGLAGEGDLALLQGLERELVHGTPDRHTRVRHRYGIRSAHHGLQNVVWQQPWGHTHRVLAAAAATDVDQAGGGVVADQAGSALGRPVDLWAAVGRQCYK